MKGNKHMKTSCVPNSPKAMLIAVIGLLSLLFATTSPAPLVSPKPPPPSVHINSATADLTTLVMTITGANFGTAPSVILGNNTLTVNTSSSSPTKIVATIPNSVDPGSYLLLVTNPASNSTASFYVTTLTGATGGGDGGVPHGMQEFTTPGGHLFTVPEGVTRLLVEVWGAGGGGGQPGCAPSYPGGYGGAGAYSREVINISGDTITVMVGQAGGPGGQGASSSVTAGNITITSGGGGGGGQADCGGPGPNGSPGTPDSNAAIGRASSSNNYLLGVPSAVPAYGSIEPLGGYGGKSATGGTNGYVFIQW